jgi:hypothetical protein
MPKASVSPSLRAALKRSATTSRERSANSFSIGRFRISSRS